jgi:zinc finger protein
LGVVQFFPVIDSSEPTTGTTGPDQRPIHESHSNKNHHFNSSRLKPCQSHILPQTTSQLSIHFKPQAQSSPISSHFSHRNLSTSFHFHLWSVILMSVSPTATSDAFIDLSPNAIPQELESLCMNCHQNGTTVLLLTRIPFFREVMISRFECPHCQYSNRGVQFAGTFPAKGVRYLLHVSSPSDLNRRVIKSCHGVVSIPALNFEIPGPTQGDSISTIEGILRQSHEGLSQVERTPELAEFLEQLDICAKGLVQFDLILDDPSGNSFIENPRAPEADPGLSVTFYRRTSEQAIAIGLVPRPASDGFDLDDGAAARVESVFAAEGSDEVKSFPTDCPACAEAGETRSCTLSIPHFKEIVIMAFNCEKCGYRSGEVMVGGGLSEQARRVTLRVAGSKDLLREVIKSDMAAVFIPECGLELLAGTLGGKFTTVEGLVRDIQTNLKERNPFAYGDSATNEAALDRTIEALRTYVEEGVLFTLILDDPTANSYIQGLPEAPGELVIEDYDRTDEQNEMLGLNDIRTKAVETPEGVVYVK